MDNKEDSNKDSNEGSSSARGDRSKLKIRTKVKLLQLKNDAAQRYAEKYKALSESRRHNSSLSDAEQNIVLQNSSQLGAIAEESSLHMRNEDHNIFLQNSSHVQVINEEVSNSFEFSDRNIGSNSEQYDSNFDSSAHINDKFDDIRGTNRNESSFLQFNNMIMFPQSGLQVNHVIEMLMGYFIQFGVVEEARTKLINIIKVLAGPLFKDLNISNYMLNKVMDAPLDTIIFHYYCKQCEKEILHSSVKSDIKGQIKLCQQCQCTNKIELSNNKYFLTVNFEYQLQLLLKNEEVKDYLIQQADKSTENMTTEIKDIQDSILYKKTKNDFPTTITYNISTDGAPVSNGKSGTRSFWPLSVIINELPPDIRFKYILLVGIMMVSNEPQPHLMNLFIDKFKEEAVSLHTKGLTLELSENCKRTLTFTPFCVIADSVARAILQCRMKYNGYCSCSYCYQLGFYCGIIKFPFVRSDCEQRTHESHMLDVHKVELQGKAVRGVKGRSAFCDFPNIDMMRSFNLESMHNGVLGVTEQMWNLMKTKMSASERRSLDDLLTRIQPPRELHRKPEKLSKISCWKATNFKAWLFHFSIPILLDVVPKDLLHHYALFVNSMYTLSKTNITPDDLLKCKRDLIKFVAYVEINYGIQAMTFNIHLLLHATENVSNTGPFWAASAFPYESNIFILKGAATGPKGADQQMVKKSLQRLLYKCRPRDNLPDIVRDVCETFINEKRFTASAKCIGNVTLFGLCQSDDCPLDVEIYERCSYSGMILTTGFYSRSDSDNDSVVKLKNNNVVQILQIYLQSNGICALKVQYLNIESLFIDDIKIEHIWKVLSSPPNHGIVTISEVQSKMVVVDLDERQYVSSMPNCFEKQ